ncbi:MAG: T9SS type A sorting domain-containing protein [Candidatus Aegiribacteria sp.]|nr:T9SS type A sorting domain-containing protein [Candidatus Aegiribacteria sp.]
MWGTGTAASENSDIFYSIIKYSIYNDNGTPGSTGDDWLVSDNNCEISCYDHSSATPLWTYIGTDIIDPGMVDNPGRFTCNDDGTILAVGCRIDDHLAVVFFSNSSSVPITIYEDPTVTYLPRQVRLTEDGSKCILRTSVMYRVDTATGILEDSYDLGASTDCFGVSPDGSVVAYGFTAIRVAVWDGSAYNLEWARSASGYYAGGAAVADDNATIYFGCYRSDYLTNRITRHDISSSNPIWTYNYPTGTGGYQDVLEWMDCSEDGRWLVIGSWGCQTGGGPEVCVIDDQYPSTPAFTIDTPGSIFHVDITPDGNYISASGKHVHANVMGSGTDVYFAEIDHTGIEGESPHSYTNLVINQVYPNPACGSVSFSFVLPEQGPVSLDIFDISGHRVIGLFEGVLNTGEHDIATDIDLGNGLYFYRLSAEGGSAAGKLVISR